MEMSESVSPAADQRFRGSQAERIGNSVESQLLAGGCTALWDKGTSPRIAASLTDVGQHFVHIGQKFDPATPTCDPTGFFNSLISS